MDHQNQLAGIIELDADPKLDATSDDNIGQTLRRLRGSVSDASCPDAFGVSFCSTGPDWNGVDDTMSDSIVVLRADLRQLHCELESEFGRILDQLFWPSSLIRAG